MNTFTGDLNSHCRVPFRRSHDHDRRAHAHLGVDQKVLAKTYERIQPTGANSCHLEFVLAVFRFFFVGGGGVLSDPSCIEHCRYEA